MNAVRMGSTLLALLLLLSWPGFAAVSASTSGTEIRFSKEDTVCKEMLDLGLELDRILYKNRLMISYDWGQQTTLLTGPGIGLSIDVYPETDGALNYFNDIPEYKPVSRSNEVLENIRNERRISWVEKGDNITGTSRYILYNNNIIIIIKGSTTHEDGFDLTLAADILERHALAVLAEKLNEYFFSGVVKGSDGSPLRHVQVLLKVEDQVYKTTTDSSGYYSIEYDGPVKKGYNCSLIVPLQYRRSDKTYFRVLYGTQPVWLAKRFRLSSSDDLMQDIDFRQAVQEGSPTYSGKPELGFLSHFSAIYFHMSEAVDFYLDAMKFNLDYKLPVDVVAGYSYGTLYTPTTSTIYIDYRDMAVDSPDRPMNREWHELSHHAMFSMYGEWPERPAGTQNHAGFINPSTGDSFAEGFAEFMSLMIADYYNYPDPAVYARFGSLEVNYQAWQYRGKAEEFAVAGVLWDLYDGKNDDAVDLTENDMWYILKDFRADFTAVYEFLIEKYSDQQAGIDQIFVDHGFFVDKTAGNRQWDPAEPFIDANGNRRFDQGEEFVDYALPKIEYTRGEVIGPASNYQRPQRRSAGELPGQFIKVDNAYPYYLIDVVFPNQSDLNYQIRSTNRDGLVYVQLPPPQYEAILQIRPENTAGVTSIEISNQDPMFADSTVYGQGFLLEHDFNISEEPAPDDDRPDILPDLADKPFPEWEERAWIIARPDDYIYTDVEFDFLAEELRSESAAAIPDVIWIGAGLLLVLGVMVVSVLGIARRR